jgi:ornithine cyclodeaminase/alanine dehydrogenase-like protein (mu-crystallin family)
MRECIEAMEELYRESGGEIDSQPARVITRVDPQSLILTMPSYSARLRRFSVKLVTEFKRNPKEFGIPSQGGITALLDGSNSRVLALVDSAALTAVRTGAVSGLATKLLSRRDSKSVGVIGSGQQARTQLQAVCAVRKVREVRVYSPHPAHARSFAEEMTADLDADVEACRSPSRAARGADIVIAATNSAVPVLKSDDLSPGCHINSIGALPERVELAPEVISNSSVYVDTRDGVLREAGDVINAIRSGLFSEEKIVADLAGVIRNPALGRRRDSEVTLFKSVGFGLQDLYACSHLYDMVSRNLLRFYPDVWTVKLPEAKL